MFAPPDGRTCPCPRQGWHPLCATHPDPQLLAAVELMYEPAENEPRVRAPLELQATAVLVACAAGATAIISTMAYRLLRRH